MMTAELFFCSREKTKTENQFKNDLGSARVNMPHLVHANDWNWHNLVIASENNHLSFKVTNIWSQWLVGNTESLLALFGGFRHHRHHKHTSMGVSMFRVKTMYWSMSYSTQEHCVCARVSVYTCDGVIRSRDPLVRRLPAPHTDNSQRCLNSLIHPHVHIQGTRTDNMQHTKGQCSYYCLHLSTKIISINCLVLTDSCDFSKSIFKKNTNSLVFYKIIIISLI